MSEPSQTNQGNPALTSLIGGGQGSREAPFRFLPCPADRAAAARLLFLQDIFRGSMFWRVVDIQIATELPNLEVARVETVELTADKRVASERRFYFDLQDVDGRPGQFEPLGVWEGPGGLILPFEIGWLHYNGVNDNRLTNDFFDQTVLYSAPGTKAAVYVYDTRDAHVTREDELGRSVAAIAAPDMQDTWPVATVGPFLAKFLLIGQDLSIVAVAKHERTFVKLRLTHVDGGDIRPLMAESFHRLADIVQGWMTPAN